jgi:CO/xanthine dehydrogenase FAD-binding subunit
MHQINSHNKAVTPRETVRKGASLAARQTEPADVEVLNVAASAPIFQKKKKKNFLIKIQKGHVPTMDTNLHNTFLVTEIKVADQRDNFCLLSLFYWIRQGDKVG